LIKKEFSSNENPSKEFLSNLGMAGKMTKVKPDVLYV
jgi:hypothetical protein